MLLLAALLSLCACHARLLDFCRLLSPAQSSGGEEINILTQMRLLMLCWEVLWLLLDVVLSLNHHLPFLLDVRVVIVK